MTVSVTPTIGGKNYDVSQKNEDKIGTVLRGVNIDRKLSWPIPTLQEAVLFASFFLPTDTNPQDRSGCSLRPKKLSKHIRSLKQQKDPDQTPQEFQ